MQPRGAAFQTNVEGVIHDRPISPGYVNHKASSKPFKHGIKSCSEPFSNVIYRDHEGKHFTHADNTIGYHSEPNTARIVRQGQLTPTMNKRSPKMECSSPERSGACKDRHPEQHINNNLIGASARKTWEHVTCKGEQPDHHMSRGQLVIVKYIDQVWTATLTGVQGNMYAVLEALEPDNIGSSFEINGVGPDFVDGGVAAAEMSGGPIEPIYMGCHTRTMGYRGKPLALFELHNQYAGAPLKLGLGHEKDVRYFEGTGSQATRWHHYRADFVGVVNCPGGRPTKWEEWALATVKAIPTGRAECFFIFVTNPHYHGGTGWEASSDDVT